MTEKEEWRRIKELEAVPLPGESCLFHGTDGHLRATHFMPQGKPGDLRSLASLQEADKVCAKNWAAHPYGQGWMAFLPSQPCFCASILIFSPLKS